MDRKAAQQRLAMMWLVGGLALALLLIIQLAAGKYGDKSKAVVEWFVPLVLPTVSLTLTAVIATGRSGARAVEPADGFAFKLAWLLSLMYLLIVAAVMVFCSTGSASAAVESLSSCNPVVAGVQGIVAVALGAFFANKSPEAA
jgi:hypothetical protein